jgi:hypothetical protein
MTGLEMHKAAELATGRMLRYKTMGWTLPKMLGLVMPMLREVSAMSYLWRTPHSLDGSKLEAFIGPVQNTPPAEALQAAIADLSLDGAQKHAA